MARGASSLSRAVASASRVPARHAYYHHRWVRRALRLALWRRLRSQGYDLSHLPFHSEEEAVGPVQRDEALVLFALTRVLRPRVVVEIGFLGGQSAFNFLRALTPGAKLYSFDIAPESAAIARHAFAGFPDFVFQRVSQDEIGPQHLGGQTIDLLFLDASHDLERNLRTFDRLAGLVADDGLLVVHDTGAWARDSLRPIHQAIAGAWPDMWATPDLFEHQREERGFVNWLLEHRPEYAQVHLHSTKTVRHGMTLLQRRAPLPSGPAKP
jgi:predicted O-methyltransferase YrrM